MNFIRSIVFCFLVQFSWAQEVKEVESFKNVLENCSQEDQIYVVNLWATWCAPCIKELPYFEALQKNHPELKVIMVSLDFPKDKNQKLIPFLKKKNSALEQYLIKNTNYNSWMHEVDAVWTGSIPATLVVKNDKKVFVEHAFESEKELWEWIDTSNLK